ncbi:MAG TPA: response regulator [Opitutaceae bacterium]
MQEESRLNQLIEITIQGGVTEEQRLLSVREASAAEMVEFTSNFITYGTLGAVIVVMLVGLIVTRSITRPLKTLAAGASEIGRGNYAFRVKVEAQDEVGQLANIFNRMCEQVQERQARMDEQDWLKSSVAEIGRLIEGKRDLAAIAASILSDLAARLALPQLTFYFRKNGEHTLTLLASYAAENPKLQIAEGEGLAGQCVREGKRILVTDVPASYLVRSTLGSAQPAFILLQPATFEGQVKGVIEAAGFNRPTALHLALLDRIAETLGIFLTTIEANQLTEHLLDQSRELTEALQLQQKELETKNATLESQTLQLKKSESLLQEQQEELRQSNEELQQANEELRQTTEEMEEKANLLTEQKKEVEKINREVEFARERLERQTEQLELTSKYKSEFLANMSHELRTPLNSLLILSKMLADNQESTLTPKQVQYAKTIQSSGHDLLELINDILDLSKIEAGKVDLEVQEVPLSEIAQFAETNFRPIADQKKLSFVISVDPALPKVISTDRRRLEQIIKNLLSNAFKFTEKGSIELGLSAVLGASAGGKNTKFDGDTAISFSVIDTGIGIPEEKLQLIFEAFQQADAGTARRYGGTGLGLSISRELARLLHGVISVQSEPGRGSTFTLLLPTQWTAQQSSASTAAVEKAASSSPARTHAHAPRRTMPVDATVASPAQIPSEGIEDDRESLKPGDTVLLIIEDDINFARIMVDFAREKKFKAVVARTATQGMALAQVVKPSAITLDLRLPDQDGWVVIDWIKHHPQMRHIPVHIISVDEERERSLRLGAVSFLQKPVTRETLDHALSDTMEFLNRPVKTLLLVEDDESGRSAVVDLIADEDVKVTAVGTGEAALSELERQRFDCIVLDLGLPDMKGAALLKEIHRRLGNKAPPVIVYTGQELSREEETELRMNAESIIVKSVRSPERLLDETALFLHRVQSKLPDAKRKLIEQGQRTDPILLGRKVLVVDDDVRNIFAITSALESYQMNVIYAESGKAALDILKSTPDVDIILMDVMMPEMDGFQTIREIRKNDRFKKTPIISVTAKAMKGDREKCLDAGASDYLAKPVDMDKLRSLLRVWLYR